jgi:NADH-quinone oxidoreductase subunit C
MFNNSYLKLLNFVLQDKINFFKKTDSYYILSIKPKNLFDVILFLKDSEISLFKMLMDIIIVDYPDKTNRFSINYSLLSIKYNTRLFLNFEINELMHMLSIVNIYKSSCWLERECWDMFGVFFENHPDLRRILSDYGFNGYPLRKDFPLTGYL